MRSAVSKIKHHLQDALKESKEILGSEHLQEKLEVGAVLWGYNNLFKSMIENLKEEIREQGASEENRSLYKTEVGDFTVTYIKPKTVLQKTAAIVDLEKDLGEHFGDLFEKKVTTECRAKFEEIAMTLPPEIRKKAMQVVEQKASKARISFVAEKKIC